MRHPSEGADFAVRNLKPEFEEQSGLGCQLENNQRLVNI